MLGNPSLHLEGKVLDGGWIVGPQIPIGASTSHGTGGNFTVAYHVTGPIGEKGFLKALDYSRAMHAPDVAQALNAMTAAYIYERDVLNKCRGLDRVVHAIADGTIQINEPGTNGVVEYLIFELADGDVRKFIKFSSAFDVAWALRSLHHVATGLKQMHGRGVAHQDLKPSNVLMYSGVSKLADLGRAAYQGHAAAHLRLAFAGDPTYAPPDLAYGFVNPEWSQWRLGCDVYHLGSMIVFFFTGVGMTPLIMKYLDPAFHPMIFGGGWTGTFEAVLPYLRNAFDQAVLEFSSQIKNAKLRDKLVVLVRQMCDPDTRLRGHPKHRASTGNSFSLERYITDFDLLARRAEIGWFKESS